MERDLLAGELRLLEVEGKPQSQSVGQALWVLLYVAPRTSACSWEGCGVGARECSEN